VTDVELASVVGAVVAGADEVDAVVVSDAVVMASVVEAVNAETMPVLKVPIMMRLITRMLAAENAITLFFIPSYIIYKNLIKVYH
jgi:hypothetical protein